jgi:hypothetical protein
MLPVDYDISPLLMVEYLISITRQIFLLYRFSRGLYGIAPCVDIAEFAWPIFLDVNFEIPFVTECIPGLVEDVEISFVSKVAVFATVKLCNTRDNIIHSKYTDNECIHK